MVSVLSKQSIWDHESVTCLNITVIKYRLNNSSGFIILISNMTNYFDFKTINSELR